MTNVLIAIPTLGSIHPRFLSCAMELKKPDGYKLVIPYRVVTDAARNEVVKYALKKNFSHVFFIDDDMTFPPTVLEDLLKRSIENPKLAGVSALSFARHAPHHPFAFNRKGKDPIFVPITNLDAGFIEVDAISTACVVFPTWVFGRTEFPWFEYLYIGPMRTTEDIAFCLKMSDLGIKFGVDTGIKLGHLGEQLEIRAEHHELYLEAARKAEAAKQAEPARP
jgi:GT2 family glycosyltransferase